MTPARLSARMCVPEPPAPSPAPPGPPGDRSFRSQPGSGQWPETPDSGGGPGQPLEPWERLEAAPHEPRAPSLGPAVSGGGRVQLPMGLGCRGLRRRGQVAVAPRAHPHPGFGDLCSPPPSTHESQLQAPLGSWGKAQRAPDCPRTFQNAASDGLLGLTQDAWAPQPSSHSAAPLFKGTTSKSTRATSPLWADPQSLWAELRRDRGTRLRGARRHPPTLLPHPHAL